MDEKICTIESLKLPVRAKNAISCLGIKTVSQILDSDPAFLLSQRNFGKKTLDAIREKLVEKGYDLSKYAIGREATQSQINKYINSRSYIIEIDNDRSTDWCYD